MRISLDAKRGRVIGEATWHKGLKAAAQQIGGYRYDAKNKRASWPLSMGTLHHLRRAFPTSLQVDPLLYVWARSVMEAPGPSGVVQRTLATAMESRPYQLIGAERIARQPALAVLDEPGLGKTAQALAGLMLAGAWEGRHLVLCPKTAVNPTWVDQVTRWSDGEVFACVGTAKQKQAVLERFLAAQHGARFLVTNPEMLRVVMGQYCPRCERWIEATIPAEHEGQRGHSKSWRIRSQALPGLFAVEWDSIIADECDRYMLGLRPQTGRMPQWGEGLVRLHSKRKLAMTGTPFRGKEVNVFGILHWLDPRRNSAFWGFVNDYFVQVDDGYGIEIGGIRPDREEAFGELLDEYSIRRLRTEVRSDLPANVFIDHWVTMEPGQARQYREFAEQGYTRLESGVLRSKGVLSTLTRAKQMAFGAMEIRGDKVIPTSSAKVDLLFDQLASRGIKGLRTGPEMGTAKFIVASQFTMALDWISDLLEARGVPHLVITGQVTGKARDAAHDSFRDDPAGPRILLLQTQTGVSLTLDTYCDEMFILDETFVEDEQVQLRGRIDNRGNRVAPRLYHYIRTRDTIDETMAADNLHQASWQHALLDGRRGLELTAQLLGRTL